MQFKLALLALAASASASAADDMSKRDADLPPRQVNGLLSPGCRNLPGFPTPPVEVVMAIVTQLNTDPCKFKPPQSLSSEFSSFSSAASSWVAQNTDKATACPLVAQITASCDAETSATGSSATGSSNGAPRETGMAMAAAAAAGLVAAVL